MSHTTFISKDATARDSKSPLVLMSIYPDECKIEAMTVRYLYGTDITTRNEVEPAATSQ
jgi:hypothetical protein